jgi:hypothetical protein
MTSLSRLFFLLLFLSNTAMAFEFPTDWKNWKKVTTPLSQIGALPGCDADVSSLPTIYQETVATYCAVKPGGPGKVSVLIKPDAMPAFNQRTGKFSDGAQMILHLEDLKVLFITGYNHGTPEYQVHLEDGKNITAKDGALSSQTCLTCHTGFQAFCINGQCATAINFALMVNVQPLLNNPKIITI